MKLEECQIGKNVWFEERWSQSQCNGTICDLPEKAYSNKKDKKAYFVYVLTPLYGKMAVLVENLYPSAEALAQAKEKEQNDYIASLNEQIQTIEDLVQFMYSHTVSCAEEYTDWDARAAVKEIALKKFGIQLT